MEILYKWRRLGFYGCQQGDPPSAGPEEGGSNPFRTRMKAAHQTFDIRCSVIRAAAMRLAILPAELRLICP
jgi:hypothetical protein